MSERGARHEAWGYSRIRRLPHGLIVTCGWLGLHVVAMHFWPSLRWVSSLTLLAVVYATYRDGPRIGAISGVISMSYFALVFSDKRLFEYGRPELERLAAIALAIPCVIALVDALRTRAVEGELAAALAAERAARQAAEVEHERRLRSLAEGTSRELERQVAARTAALSDSLYTLEQLSSAIAHDLRNAVRYISGHAELLRSETAGRLTEAHAASVERICRNAARIDTLIDDFLRLTRTHEAEVRLSAVDPRAAVDEVLGRFAPRIAAAKAAVEIAPGLPAVWAAPKLVAEIFAELIDNALKFSKPDRPPRIRIGGEADRRGVRLFIADDGAGIAAGDAPKLFQPFAHFHPNESYFGHGIGLAIAARLMHRVGGSIRAESTPGAGSRFWLEFQPPPGG